MTAPRDDHQHQAPLVRVDLTHPTPAYEQIRAQLAEMITSGDLPTDTRLPPIRQLAADLGLAGGTIARAYHELEQAGLVHGHGRRGTLVRARPDPEASEQRRDLATAAEHFTNTALAAGLDPDTILAATRAALTRIRPPHTITQH